MHDVEWVHAVGPFFCTDGEADTPPSGLTCVAAAGDGACVEGIHDAFYAFLGVMFCLSGFIVALCLVLVSTLFCLFSGRCL